MTGVEPIDVVKKLRAYLMTLAVGTYSSMKVYTAPNEEIQNKDMKYFIVIEYGNSWNPYEIGDSEGITVVGITLRVGYRYNQASTRGEKLIGDTFKQHIVRKLRSRAFRFYMHQTQTIAVGPPAEVVGLVTTAPDHAITEVLLPYDRTNPGLHMYELSFDLWTFISTDA